ncbi:inner membrane protein of type IV secretion of T-DNA complex VirB6 [Vibrio astriarenae]|nr:inner membrane protein of type IV secretion of T-DNA complex VirB6 [Vibrio sp. C7]
MMNTFQLTNTSIAPFSYLGETINNLTKTFIVYGTGNMMDWLKPIVLVGVAMYFMVKGYQQLFGDSRELAPDVVKQSVIILCITTLALNVSEYTLYIKGFIDVLGAELSAAIHSGNNTPDTVYDSLDKLLIDGIGQASQSLGHVGITSPSSWGWIISAS